MQKFSALSFVVIALIGFLTASTIYFYLQSRETDKQITDSTAFDGVIPIEPNETIKTRVDELTVPDDPRGRLSYPAHTHKIQPQESLILIASRMEIDPEALKKANRITDENIIQAGQIFLIPRLHHRTDSYRLNFLINDERASELNRELRDKQEDRRFSPVETVKMEAINFFGITKDDEFNLLEQDLSRGTAVVEAKGKERLNLIGLVQPKNTGQRGLWAVLYIENRK